MSPADLLVATALSMPLLSYEEAFCLQKIYSGSFWKEILEGDPSFDKYLEPGFADDIDLVVNVATVIDDG